MVKEQPGDYRKLDELGAAFFQKARETGDVANFDLAEKALTRSLELAPSDFHRADPLVHLALVYMGEHRFNDVLTVTQQAIALGSGNLSAFAIEGDAYTDLGDYENAEAAYQAARALGAASSAEIQMSYLLDSRMAYLRFIHGDSAAAIELMKKAIAAGLQTNVPRENLAWLYYELGERCFQAGLMTEADLAYRAGLAADPVHYRALAGLGKLRGAQGRFPESIELYKKSLDVVPFPQYVAELGDVLTRSGDSKSARREYDLVEYIARIGKLNESLANRELALFYADQNTHLEAALDMARKELQIRRDVYTWDTLAWVLFKLGRVPEAADAISKATRFHTQDSILLFHAGMIAKANKDEAAAARDLKEALALNPAFHPLYAATAAQVLLAIRPDTSDASSSATASR